MVTFFTWSSYSGVDGKCDAAVGSGCKGHKRVSSGCIPLRMNFLETAKEARTAALKMASSVKLITSRVMFKSRCWFAIKLTASHFCVSG